MKLCVLRCVMGGWLYRSTGIADTGIEDNVLINENIQK